LLEDGRIVVADLRVPETAQPGLTPASEPQAESKTASDLQCWLDDMG
jgi:hypothetical protein